jgi:hypothetical protein
LRAVTSLARLWAGRGESQEAHDLLAPIYGWFTEGLDTADLRGRRRCSTGSSERRRDASRSVGQRLADEIAAQIPLVNYAG